MLTEPDVSTWCLSFPNEDGDLIDVTAGNAAQYVEWHVNDKLLKCREKQLAALKTGFFAVDSVCDMRTFLSVFNASDLMLALGGEPTIDSRLIVRALTFHPKSWKVSGRTPRYIKRFLSELSLHGLRQFLRLTTSLFTVPYGGFKKKRIVIQQSNRIFGHSCSFALELPEFDRYEDLRKSLLQALAQVEAAGFSDR